MNDEEGEVRIFRMIEYRGPRSWVEKQVRDSIHGTKTVDSRFDRQGDYNQEQKAKGYITAVTIGDFPTLVASNEPAPAVQQVGGYVAISNETIEGEIRKTKEAQQGASSRDNAVLVAYWDGALSVLKWLSGLPLAVKQ